MSKPYRLWAAALAGVFILGGCVSQELHDKKVIEATDLRNDLETAENRIRSLKADIEDLQKQIVKKRMDNEEITESLSMARRYGQKIETDLADFRARVSSQSQENKISRGRTAELSKSLDTSRNKVRELEESIITLRSILARFQDRLRLQVQLEKDLIAQLERETEAGTINVSRQGDRVIIGLKSSILFSSGSAAIRTSGKKHLKKISRILARYINREIQVQGHTDNIPISDRLADRWESNWELSAARATRVLRYLVEVGNTDPRRISAAAMGEFRPIADNSSKTGRKKNRRIDIVLFPPSL